MTRISKKQITWGRKILKDETERKRFEESLKICHILFHENEINDIEVARASIISDDNVLAIFNSKLSKYDGFTINSINVNDIIKKYEEFILHKIYTKIGNFDNYDISDKEIEIAMKNALDIKDGMTVTDILSKSDSVVSAIVDIIKSHQIKRITTESTNNVADAEIIDKVPSDEEINNSVDINKELDEEAQEEIPDEEVMNDAEEAQEEIPDEEVMNDAEIKEEKNEETIAEAQEEKKEETIVSSSSEAAERFITDEDLLEKVGDKFFEEAKDKINRIVKNKSLAKKQKKNRINRIVKSYSHKVKEDNELDPIKEAERKEKIITETVEERKPIEPKVRYIKDFKDLNDKLAHNEEVLTTFKNAKFDKMVADIIRKYPAITINKFDNIYRLDIDKMDQNGRVFEDTFFISFDQEYDVIDGNRKGTKIGGPIIIAFKNNKYLATGLTLDTFNYIIINGSWVLPDDGISTNDIRFEIKRAS